MAKRQIKYDRLTYQNSFHESRKFYDLLSAGFGAGKTYSLCMKGFDLMNQNRGLPGGLLCPNLKMFKRDVLPTFEEICDLSRIRFKFHRQDFYLHFPDTNSKILIFHSEDDGYSIKGPNLAFGLINEVNLCTKPAFDAFISRIRLKRAGLRQVAMSGTPEGFNWVYDFFISRPRDDADVFFGDVRENINVAPEYVKMLLDSYDDKVAQQYVEGKFVNINALAALHKFNRQKHTGQIARNKDLPVWASCDFNVDPMAGTLYNRAADYSKGPKLLGFDEIKIKGADSNDLARAIIEKAGVPAAQIVVFPDPAGSARSTKSPVTDIEILQSHGFRDIRYKRRIASIRDCLNAANAFLVKDGLILDADKCKHTIIDFEQTMMKQGAGELDKADINRTHWVDGFKNMIDYEFPIVAKVGGWREVNIR